MAYVYEDQARQDILRMVPSDGKRIGSIGCGSAATEVQLVRAGREVHGVDIAPEAIARAAQRLTSARLVKPGDRDLFEPASLDGLILADVIEHIPEAWDWLKTFAGYVKPGGWVVISVPNMRGVAVLGEFLVKGDWPEHPTGIFDATHIQNMSRKRLDRWCRAAGLTVETRFDRILFMRHPRATPVLKWANRLTLRLFSDWFQLQVQVRCRRGAAGAAAS